MREVRILDPWLGRSYMPCGQNNQPARWETWVQSLGCPCIGKIPWRRERLSTPIFLPGESRERRSLMGCSPWGRKELDTTERLNSPNRFLFFPPHRSFFADIFYGSPDSQPINHMVCALSLPSFITLMLLILDVLRLSGLCLKLFLRVSEELLIRSPQHCSPPSLLPSFLHTPSISCTEPVP